jgi:ATP-dependent RNA helicase RhlE
MKNLYNKFVSKGSGRSNKSRTFSKNPSFDKSQRLPKEKPKADPRKAADQPPKGVFTALLPSIQKALTEEGYIQPTPIQEQAIPHILDGRDIIGCAQTGTGKTAAFTLPLLQHIENATDKVSKNPSVLVLAPTRELAAQIGENVEKYSRHLKVRTSIIYGGVNQNPQVKEIKAGIDILIATPGRLLDLISQKFIRLNEIDFLVLDEADRMLDMGFLPDIKKIMKLVPIERQSLFFSATMNTDIGKLARSLVHKPAQVNIEPEKPAVERINQTVYFVEKKDKDTLLKSLITDNKMTKVIVFTQMKHVANKVTERLVKAGIKAAAIHGNKSQAARTKALESFKSTRIRVLVATDIAARGIDVEKISHVVNFDLPNEPETYVHRIGRTARAGHEGEAHSFCSAEERNYLRMIEVLLRKPIPSNTDHPQHSEFAMNATGADAKPGPKKKAPLTKGKKYAKVKGGMRDSNYSKTGIKMHRNSGKRKGVV